ncbi:S41 family peptidase [Thalassotalea sp. Y01]|uniref:S41 family peptidase n=1 Tax=Thalassotalea sp. Y01 TaxID=2729613 RepID=UPI00145D0355|nr:S41 family peptidase [Thalassotalea sp. Y01]NMP15890.1 hypothetical protein [Thalassotalea sp. Y01]
MQRLWILITFILSTCFVQAGQQQRDDSSVISSSEAKLVIGNIVSELEHTYLYPDKGVKASRALQQASDSKDMQSNQSSEWFRDEIRRILLTSTQDTGFDIVLEKELLQSSANGTDFDKLSNGNVNVEILESNIGHLTISENFIFADSHQILLDAFQLMANVEAMIIDLRAADHVDLSLVQQMISFFIKPETLIGNVQFNNHTSPLMSLKTPGYDKLKDDFPLYIINSAFVSGEWEFFSHSLQQFDKAVVLGAETMGLGYFTKPINVGSQLIVKIPYAVIKDPVSEESWDKHGVTPDVFAKDEEVVDKAFHLALTALSE